VHCLSRRKNRAGREVRVNLETSARKEVGRLLPKRGCDPEQVKKGHVSLPAFDLTHMRAVDPGGVGQRFLRQMAFPAAFANELAEAR